MAKKTITISGWYLDSGMACFCPVDSRRLSYCMGCVGTHK